MVREGVCRCGRERTDIEGRALANDIVSVRSTRRAFIVREELTIVDCRQEPQPGECREGEVYSQKHRLLLQKDSRRYDRSAD